MSEQPRRPFSVWVQSCGVNDAMRITSRHATLDSACAKARKEVAESRGGLSVYAIVRDEAAKRTLERFVLRGFDPPIGWTRFNLIDPKPQPRLTWRDVVRHVPSVRNRRRWIAELACGHEVSVDSRTQPHAHQRHCPTCAEAS